VGQPEISFLGRSLGSWGVSIFFIISGYLLAGTTDFSWRYFWRRCLRIFPGLVVVIFLCAFVLGPIVSTLPFEEYFQNPLAYKYLWRITTLGWLFGGYNALPGVFASNPIPNAINGSLWVIPYLLSMYVVLYVFARMKFLQKRYLLLIAYLAAWPVVILKPTISVPSLVQEITGLPGWYLHSFFIMKFCDLYLLFMIGVLISVFRDMFKTRLNLLILTAFLIAASYWTGFVLIVHYMVFPAMIIVIGSASFRWQRNIIADRDISYGLYIYAFPVQQTIVQVLPTICFWGMFMLTMIVTTVLAVLSWKFVENPAQRLKNWF